MEERYITCSKYCVDFYGISIYEGELFEIEAENNLKTHWQVRNKYGKLIWVFQKHFFQGIPY